MNIVIATLLMDRSQSIISYGRPDKLNRYYEPQYQAFCERAKGEGIFTLSLFLSSLPPFP